jgi:hypothetical protein
MKEYGCTRNCPYCPVYSAGDVDVSTISTTMSFSYSNPFTQTPLFLIPLKLNHMRFACATPHPVAVSKGKAKPMPSDSQVTKLDEARHHGV